MFVMSTCAFSKEMIVDLVSAVDSCQRQAVLSGFWYAVCVLLRNICSVSLDDVEC